MAREMKDSGVEWIGEIPKDWEIIKNKYIFNIKKAKLPSKFFDDNTLIPYMSMDYIRNPEVIPLFAKDGDFCSKDDILLLWDGSNAGEIIFNHPEGYAPSTTAILKLKKNIKQNFSQYYLKFFEKYLKKTVVGMGIPHVNGEILKNSIFLIPPLKEQEKIANYLDKKVADIDLIIEKTKATIENYKKYKQSIITEAVTKGLNPNVEMKDSGIEWIGEIPKHWKIFPIKYILQWKSIKNYPKETVLSLYRDLGVIPKNSRDDNHNVTSEDTASYKFVERGDFVINKMKAWQGSMAVSEYQGIISPAYHVCSFKTDKLNKKYFHYLLRNQLYLPEFRRLSTGLRIGQWDLGFEDFKKLPYLFPSLEEQKEIAEYLNKKTCEIDNLIAKKESLISEMEEYKKSLIYECVTGKKEII